MPSSDHEGQCTHELIGTVLAVQELHKVKSVKTAAWVGESHKAPLLTESPW